MTALLSTRGAISVEYLIAFLPVMLFFASVWQLADLYAAHLIAQRAASAVGRAASVVLPDDPHYYGGAEVNAFAGARKTQIELAANLVLRASYLSPAHSATMAFWVFLGSYVVCAAITWFAYVRTPSRVPAPNPMVAERAAATA